jgi:signal transduction histidine kinase
MNQKLSGLSQQYLSALRKHLSQGPRADLQPALRLGGRAVVLGLETLELARLHEQAVADLHLSSGQDGVEKRAEAFFAEAITPIVETHRAARQSKIELKRLGQTLNRRTSELAATNRQLQPGVQRRRRVEAALKSSGANYARMLRQSLQSQQELRLLTHRVMASQEEDRKKISLELQNEIAQTLLGINVRLLTLKQEARHNTQGLTEEIANTQRLVVKSARSVRRVAREFRKS